MLLLPSSTSPSPSVRCSCAFLTPSSPLSTFSPLSLSNTSWQPFTISSPLKCITSASGQRSPSSPPSMCRLGPLRTCSRPSLAWLVIISRLTSITPCCKHRSAIIKIIFLSFIFLFLLLNPTTLE
ncbi:hypothetical protein MUK42_00876 [Musa troglodytarum]|uniref:Uncharacterized protein n=1 Tax=Musa troglodytarum TaxID=320322 RepID=A0A9E7GN09_9LILI|nr:hypothetical protein MUK42_00876 [Musa troglodytarum]